MSGEWKSWGERLKDPRWQRRRLEIMSRDDFHCCLCGDRKSTLNVHHRIYVRGQDPWDYDDDHLQTVCETCHGKMEVVIDKMRMLVSFVGPDNFDFFMDEALRLHDEEFGIRAREPVPEDVAALYGLNGIHEPAGG